MTNPTHEPALHYSGDLPYLSEPLNTYGAALAAHGAAGYTAELWLTCRCGRKFRTANGRGLHASAEERKASKQFELDAEAAREGHRAALKLDRARAEYNATPAVVEGAAEIPEGSPQSGAWTWETCSNCGHRRIDHYVLASACAVDDCPCVLGASGEHEVPA